MTGWRWPNRKWNMHTLWSPVVTADSLLWSTLELLWSQPVGQPLAAKITLEIFAYIQSRLPLLLSAAKWLLWEQLITRCRTAAYVYPAYYCFAGQCLLLPAWTTRFYCVGKLSAFFSTYRRFPGLQKDFLSWEHIVVCVTVNPCCVELVSTTRNRCLLVKYWVHDCVDCGLSDSECRTKAFAGMLNIIFHSMKVNHAKLKLQ